MTGDVCEYCGTRYDVEFKEHKKPVEITLNLDGNTLLSAAEKMQVLSTALEHGFISHNDARKIIKVNNKILKQEEINAMRKLFK